MKITLACLLLSSACLLIAESASAQVGTATRSVLTAKGVETVTVTGVDAAVPPKAVVNPNPSTPGLRWVHPDPAAVVMTVSAGNRGTFAWLGETQNSQRVLLAATTDDAGGVPIYEDLATGSDIVATAAADKSPLCLIGVRNITSGASTVRLYSGFSATPISSVPVNTPNGPWNIAISDDGARAVVGYVSAGGTPSVDVYSTAAGLTLINSYAVPGANGFRTIDLSGDGNVIQFGTDNGDILLKAAAGATIFSDASGVSVDAHAIDRTGDTFVRGGFDIGAWKKSGATYQRVVNFADPSLGFFVSTACDVSGDGSTFVAAAYDATNANRLRVYAYALTPSGSQLLWTYANDGTGNLQDTPAAVSISDDGRWIAVASWGAQFNGHPEVLLFDRDAGNVPVASIDTPGSAFDCDISGDGQFVVVGTKAVHANDFGSGGEGYSLDRGDQGLRLFGTPSIGRTISLLEGGLPGEGVLLVVATGLLATPLSSPSFLGTFDLAPAELVFPPLFVGTVPGSGLLVLPATIPNVPAAVGATVYAQTIRTGAPKPSIDNYLALPITP
jgi:hypothetical protein